MTEGILTGLDQTVWTHPKKDLICPHHDPMATDIVVRGVINSVADPSSMAPVRIQVESRTEQTSTASGRTFLFLRNHAISDIEARNPRALFTNSHQIPSPLSSRTRTPFPTGTFSHYIQNAALYKFSFAFPLDTKTFTS